MIFRVIHDFAEAGATVSPSTVTDRKHSVHVCLQTKCRRQRVRCSPWGDYPCENTHRTRGDARIPFAIGYTESAPSVSQVAISCTHGDS
jgi:hypothetical protein